MTINLGLVGTGIFARDSHAPAIKKVDDLRLYAVYNRTKEKAAKFAQDEGITEDHVFEDLSQLLKNPSVDAVDALLPVQFNRSIVADSLAAGKPICLEKPIASNLKDAAAIVKSAESTDLPVMILENWVYLNVVKQLKELLPKIGKPVTFQYQSTGPFGKSKYQSTGWRQKPEHIGGYLSDGGVHQLALLTEILGEVESVAAHTTQLREVSGTVDTLNSLFTMKSGAFGTFLYGSFFGATEKLLKFSIFGTDGSLIYELNRGQPPMIKLMEGPNADESSSKTIKVEDDEVNGVVAEFKNFAEAVEKKDKSLIRSPPRKAFHHFAIIAAAVESGAANGERRKVLSPEDV